ncbi:SMP-30/gluconolactonase/LRE family protein [Microlunatus parietis]|uniref:Sugar lactone lactonase YvrE n=1 Tax=Microlunatus parietis TaxID=682979 RepID=A0A7Y9ID30_9ACTN|nr:SMP-30/gluconolactonase/LRE family protein [Microlunatus parietis]NYE74515.1 sugar lactone lactonase YvrE [Microlunatus parietis]
MIATTADALAEPAGPRTVLGESARWDGEAWWWVDADPGHVWTRRPDGPAEPVVRNGGRTSLVQPDGAGAALVVQGTTLLAARRDHDRSWRLTGFGTVDVPDGWLVNDGAADASGNLWIGSIEPARTPGAGELIKVDSDGASTRQAGGITLSNGMVWSADGTELFHADTFGHVILRHRVDPASGTVTGSGVAFEIPAEDGLPDGLAADQGGGLWVALYGAGQVRRYTPDGTVDVVITIPTPQATSVELGGPDGRDVLITSAREGFSDADSAADPLAGRLFTARSPYPGRLRPMITLPAAAGPHA